MTAQARRAPTSKSMAPRAASPGPLPPPDPYGRPRVGDGGQRRHPPEKRSQRKRYQPALARAKGVLACGAREAEVGDEQKGKDGQEHELGKAELPERDEERPQARTEERRRGKRPDATQERALPLGGQRLVGGVGQRQSEDESPNRERVQGGFDQRSWTFVDYSLDRRARCRRHSYLEQCTYDVRRLSRHVSSDFATHDQPLRCSRSCDPL